MSRYLPEPQVNPVRGITVTRGRRASLRLPQPGHEWEFPLVSRLNLALLMAMFFQPSILLIFILKIEDLHFCPLPYCKMRFAPNILSTLKPDVYHLICEKARSSAEQRQVFISAYLQDLHVHLSAIPGLSVPGPVEPLLAVDRRLLGCKWVGVTSHKVCQSAIRL